MNYVLNIFCLFIYRNIKWNLNRVLRLRMPKIQLNNICILVDSYLSFLCSRETGFCDAPPTDTFIPPDWEQIWARVAFYSLTKGSFGKWLRNSLVASNDVSFAFAVNKVVLGTKEPMVRIFFSFSITFFSNGSNSRNDISTNHGKCHKSNLWGLRDNPPQNQQPRYGMDGDDTTSTFVSKKTGHCENYMHILWCRTHDLKDVHTNFK